MSREMRLMLVVICLLFFGCSKKEKFYGDFVAPVISDVGVSGISGSQVTVNWQTNEPAKSILHYGVFPTYDLKEIQPDPLTLQHKITLTQLTVNTTYHFMIEAVDGDGNSSVSSDFTFLTSTFTVITAGGDTNLAWPFYVYQDAYYPGNHFVPSGWMGDASLGTEYIEFDDKSTETSPYAGASCIKISYKEQSSNKWAGIYWQEPESNWGTLPDVGYDLTGAKKLTFWARGAKGGEKGEFKIGGIGYDPEKKKVIAPYPDSLVPALGTGEIILSTSWTQYSINFSTTHNLTHVIGGFCWVSEDKNAPTVYIDEVKYEK